MVRPAEANLLQTQGQEQLSNLVFRFKRAQNSHRNAIITFGATIASSISGLVVEYIVAIDVTRVRFPADAFGFALKCKARLANYACKPEGMPGADAE